MSKLKMWSPSKSWEENEAAWDLQAEEAERSHPIKKLAQLPNMPGITPETSKNLKWKSLQWMIAKDEKWQIMRHFLRHPIRYGWTLIKSMFKSKPYSRDDDFFLYGISSVKHFEELLKEPKTLLVVGFSYCHKPFECPSGRFTDQCIHDVSNPVCRQCFIGKAVHALSEKHCVPLFIPTIHYIGNKIFEVVHTNPDKKILFLITACELTLEMFGDWGNMVNIQGIGVRLDGRICNTMKAFELSETGIKPGLTVVLPHTQQRFLDLLRERALFKGE